MKKRAIFWVKVLVMALVVALLGHEVYKAWGKVGSARIQIDWRWGGIAVLGFCGSMLTSGWMWRWIAGRMGERAEGAKKLPTVALLGAYTFSQLGKYIPGKVALLLMRIERSGRAGMSARVCTLSTLLENAIYMISGGLVGLMAIARVAGELDARFRPWVWPATVAAVVMLLVICHPAVFYAVVDRVMKAMKRPGIALEERFGVGGVMAAVFGFFPCWVFGGLSLWASACCVQYVDMLACIWFAGAYALSVVIGMASFLPGGLGIREAVVTGALAIQLTPLVGHEKAVVLGAVGAALQRIFQVAAEVLLGIIGGVATRNKS